MSPRSVPVGFLMIVALVAAACGPNTRGDGPGGSPGAARTPGAGGSAAPVEISGDLEVGAKLGCKPAPCTPEAGAEGVADEIGYTRINLFAEKYTDVKLTFTEADFDPATFLNTVASGNPPDVVRISRDVIGTYIAEGALEPLDTCIADHGIDMTQFYEPAVAQVTSEGSVYGIPEFYSSRIILINDSVLAEANLTSEDIDTSDWDALRAVNEQLLAKDGDTITRLGFDPKLPEFLPLWAYANGVRIVSDDGLTSQLDDPKVAEALDYAVSLITAHGTAPAFFEFRKNGPGGVDFFGGKNQFAADTLGAMPMEQWYLNVLADNTPDEEISFKAFKDRQGNDISYSGGDSLAIPSSADNKVAACEFIKTMTLPDTWFAAAKVRAEKRAADGEAFTGVYSGNRAADELIFGQLVTEESAGAFYEGVQLVQAVADKAYSLPPIPGGAEFDRIWKAAVQDVMNNGTPATDALTRADQEAQDAIDDAAR